MFLAARSLWISLLLSRYFMPSQICWPKLERQMMFSVDRRDVSLRQSNKDLENNDVSLSLINNDFLTTCQLFPPHNCLAKFLWFHVVWSSVWGNVNESNSNHKPCVAHFRQISISAESIPQTLTQRLFPAFFFIYLVLSLRTRYTNRLNHSYQCNGFGIIFYSSKTFCISCKKRTWEAPTLWWAWS